MNVLDRKSKGAMGRIVESDQKVKEGYYSGDPSLGALLASQAAGPGKPRPIPAARHLVKDIIGSGPNKSGVNGRPSIKTARGAAPHALQPKILILTVPHGASHTRTAKALQAAFAAIAPDARTEVLDSLSLCARWFRAYYNSYLTLLKRWPRLWGWIEGIQHTSQATGPGWLYRCGAKPLFRFLRNEGPDIVIATEVGMCELAVLMKRHYKMDFFLAASCGLDVDRAWVQLSNWFSSRAGTRVW